MKPTLRAALVVLAVLSGSLLGGCVLRGGLFVHAEPNLVAVGPDVYVVEDHAEPVFFTDGYYWRYDGGIWYRSSNHYNGWVVVRTHAVPRVVVRIDRPGRYVHYRAHGNAHVRKGPPPPHGSPAYRKNERVKTRDNRQPAVRDHRTKQGPAVRDHRTKQGPAVRDHRDDKPKKKGKKGKKGDD